MGVVAGDMIGSVYERFPTKEMDFPLFSVYSRFTDDTVMTMANADWLLHGGNLASIMQEYGRRFHVPDMEGVTCQGTVLEAIIAFLESTDYENAIRLAISLGGDADTQGAITGGMAEAYYKEIPAYIEEQVMQWFPEDFIRLIQEFSKKYGYWSKKLF